LWCGAFVAPQGAFAVTLELEAIPDAVRAGGGGGATWEPGFAVVLSVDGRFHGLVGGASYRVQVAEDEAAEGAAAAGGKDGSGIRRTSLSAAELSAISRAKPLPGRVLNDGAELGGAPCMQVTE